MQPLEKNLVVVAGAAKSLLIDAAAPCISRNPPAEWSVCFGREWFIAVITREADDGRTRPRKRNRQAFANEPALFIATLDAPNLFRMALAWRAAHADRRMGRASFGGEVVTEMTKTPVDGQR